MPIIEGQARKRGFSEPIDLCHNEKWRDANKATCSTHNGLTDGDRNRGEGTGRGWERTGMVMDVDGTGRESSRIETITDPAYHQWNSHSFY
jgi:hypothetical protein